MSDPVQSTPEPQGGDSQTEKRNRSQKEASDAFLKGVKAWREGSKASLAYMRQLCRMIATAERARAREIMRIKTRRQKAAARKAARAKATEVTPRLRPKKPSNRDLLGAAKTGRFAERFQRNAKARREELRRIAREIGIPVKKLQHIGNLLAGFQCQELISRNSVTLPRLGQVRLILTEPRRRVVNISGQIGRGGKQGLIESPWAATAKFRPAASLRKALREAEEFDLIAFPFRSKPRPVLSPELQRRQREARVASGKIPKVK